MAIIVQSLRVLVIVVVAAILVACSSAEDRALSHYERGTSFMAAGDLPKAGLEFRNALRLRVTYPEAQFSLGMIQEQQGDFSAAARSYLTVAEQVPSHLASRVRLSYILLASNQIPEAQKYSAEALTLGPEDPSALTVNAALALKQGNGQEAIRLSEEALAKDPAFVDAIMLLASERLMQADPAGALRQLDRSPVPPEKSMGLQLLRLSALETMGDQPAVEDLFTRLVELSPRDTALRDGLVRWYLDKGRIDDAERAIRRYVAVAGGDDQAVLYLVAFLVDQRGVDAGIAELTSAMAPLTSDATKGHTLRLALAELKAESGKIDEATSELNALISMTTDKDLRGRARIQLAKVLANAERTGDALEVANSIVAEDAKNVEALGIRASLRLLEGQTAEAIEDILAALNEAPDNAGLHGLLAEAYERNGSLVLAEEQFGKALELSRYAPATGLTVAQFFMKHGKIEQALRTVENTFQRAPSNREVLELLGQLRLMTQDWIGAQQAADALRQLDQQDDSGAADRIGSAALIGLNRYDESISLLQTALNDSPNQRAVLPSLISAYVQAGKQDAAQQHLEEMIAANPADVQAMVLLGYLHAQQNEPALAEASFRRAAEDKASMEGELALAQFYLASGQAKAAEEVIDAGLASEPDSAVLKLLLAALYERGERFEEAIAVYEELHAKDPLEVSVANDLASLLSERRTDPASLERAFEIAQRLRGSEIPQYLDTLGWIHYLRGEYDEALPLLRVAASRLANLPLVHYHLGMTYAAQGQKDLARASLERALTISPPLLGADAKRAKEAMDQLEGGDAETSAEGLS